MQNRKDIKSRPTLFRSAKKNLCYILDEMSRVYLYGRFCTLSTCSPAKNGGYLNQCVCYSALFSLCRSPSELESGYVPLLQGNYGKTVASVL